MATIYCVPTMCPNYYHLWFLPQLYRENIESTPQQMRELMLKDAQWCIQENTVGKCLYLVANLRFMPTPRVLKSYVLTCKSCLLHKCGDEAHGGLAACTKSNTKWPIWDQPKRGQLAFLPILLPKSWNNASWGIRATVLSIPNMVQLHILRCTTIECTSRSLESRQQVCTAQYYLKYLIKWH